jgi:hypothetical protein
VHADRRERAAGAGGDKERRSVFATAEQGGLNGGPVSKKGG